MTLSTYRIKRSKKAKNMRLTVRENGEVVLTLPVLVPEFLGKIFVQKNTDWIKKKQNLLQRNKVNIESVYIHDFQEGQRLTFFDQKKYTIRIFKSLKKTDYYQMESGFLDLYLVRNAKSYRQHLVTQFYKDQARIYLQNRSIYFADILGVTFNQIRIKNTKTRWGSCSSKKNLNYNWRIMLAPEEVVNYLVAHEVCHLKEMNHSKSFWDLVESLDPDFKTHKKWLRTHERSLLNFLA